MPSLEGLLAWFSKEGVRDAVLATVLGAVVAGVLATFYKLVTKGGFTWLDSFQRQSKTGRELVAYRSQLDKDTFRTRHPWVKGDQTLDDILIPVVVSEGGDGGIEYLHNVLPGALRARASTGTALRMVLTGGPGSGKTVALRAAARAAWGLSCGDGNLGLVPVLVTFADLRRSGFDVTKALGAGLRAHGFGKAGSVVALDGDDVGVADDAVDEGSSAGRVGDRWPPRNAALVRGRPAAMKSQTRARHHRPGGRH
ncbi:MAG: hypothetical protein JW940_11455 [Polyangiaceae bacterium]|nr:hypothetical protein [Polyangiaceae bacterium]